MKKIAILALMAVLVHGSPLDTLEEETALVEDEVSTTPREEEVDLDVLGEDFSAPVLTSEEKTQSKTAGEVKTKTSSVEETAKVSTDRKVEEPYYIFKDDDEALHEQVEKFLVDEINELNMGPLYKVLDENERLLLLLAITTEELDKDLKDAVDAGSAELQDLVFQLLRIDFRERLIDERVNVEVLVSYLKQEYALLNSATSKRHARDVGDLPEEDTNLFEVLSYRETQNENIEKRDTLASDTETKSVSNGRLVDCEDVQREGNRYSGVYKIQPGRSEEEFDVFCDMVEDHGGWTVFQRRLHGDTFFYRDWNDYVNGFGSINRDHWLGLEKIHRISSHDLYELRIDLWDWEGSHRFAKYDFFQVAEEDTMYELLIGLYSGDAGDSMSSHRYQKFSTFDKDNDKSERNCAATYKGGWWYSACYDSNLNGLYFEGSKVPPGFTGIHYRTFRGISYSLKRVELKIRKKQH